MNTSDLFENIEFAIKSLDPEMVQIYKNMGENLYNSVNFPDSKIINKIEPPIENFAVYLKELI